MKYYIKNKTEGDKLEDDVVVLPLNTIASIDEDGDVLCCSPSGVICGAVHLNLSRWSEISSKEYLDLYARRNLCG